MNFIQTIHYIQVVYSNYLKCAVRPPKLFTITFPVKPLGQSQVATHIKICAQYTLSHKLGS
jgi:hypothetical protein